MKSQRRFFSLLCVAGVLLAGCSSGQLTPEASEPPKEESGNSDLTTVTIGVLQSVTSVPLLLAEEQGIFEKHGLQVELQTFTGGAAMVPAALNGDIDFGDGNFLSIMLGVSKGLPIKIVTPTAVPSGDPETDISAIVVGKDSEIDSLDQLKGKTIAINALASISQVAVLDALKTVGIEPDSVDIVEMPFPQISQAISQGNATAGFLLSPMPQLFADEVKTIYRPFSALYEGEAIGGYFASEEYLQEHGDIAEKFRDAFQEAAEYTNTHREEAYATLPEYLGLPEEVANKVHIPYFGGELEETPTIVEGALEYGVLAEAPDYDQLLWKGND